MFTQNTFRILDGNKYIKNVTDDQGRMLWRQGKEKTVSGAFPLSMTPSRIKPIVHNIITGNSVRTITIDGTEYVVPDGYTLLDYLQGDKTSYIEIPSITISTTDELYAEFYANNAGNRIFGVNGYTRCYVAVSGTGTGSFCGGAYAVPLSAWHIGDHVLNTVKMNASGYTVNGTTYSWSGTLSDQTLENFEINEIRAAPHGSATSVAMFKTFYIKKSDGTYKLNLVQAKNSSNAIGMYDFVTGTFFTNAGSGSFTAGAELPLPTNPLGVKGCGEKTENLWDKSKSTTNWINGSGAVVHYPDGSAQMSDYVECNAGDTLTVCGFYNGDVFSYGQLEICWYNSAKTFLNRMTINNAASVSATAPAHAAYCKFGVYKHADTSIINHDTICVKGSTAPTSYIPYGYKLTELIASNCGMVDMGTLNWTKNTSSGVTYFCTNIRDLKQDLSYATIYCVKYGSGTLGNLPAGNKRISQWASSSKSYNRISIRDDDFDNETKFKSAMSGEYLFYQRTTDSEWQAPTTIAVYIDKPLGEVSTYADTFDFADGSHVENVGVKVLDGTESWTEKSSGTKHIYYTSITDRKTGGDDKHGSCSHFDFSTATSARAEDLTMFFYSSTATGFRYDAITSLTDWKAYIAAQYAAGTPVTVWYPLATPVTTQHTAVPVTPAQGTNYVDVITDVKPSSGEITYFSEI